MSSKSKQDPPGRPWKPSGFSILNGEARSIVRSQKQKRIKRERGTRIAVKGVTNDRNGRAGR